MTRPETSTIGQPGDTLVRVDKLRIDTTRGVNIVDDVSLLLRPRRITALVGESGCGKTAVALALLGFARTGTVISSGSVRVGDVDMTGLNQRQLDLVRGSKVSYVPQDPSGSLNPRLTIGTQLIEAMTVHGRSAAQAHQQAVDLLGEVQLPATDEFLGKYPFELSGGQQQRILISMALACRPALVVLDEPTTALDVTTQASILKVIRRLADAHEVAFLHVTHDLAVVNEIADEVAVMYSGRIVEYGERELVFDAPAHPYTAMLLGCIPPVTSRKSLVPIPGTAARPGARPQGCTFNPRCPIATEQCFTEFPAQTPAHDGGAVACYHPSTYEPTLLSIADRRSVARPAVPVLTVDKLTISYGSGKNRNTVVHDVSFTIAKGECLALVGESGSGKSTTGRSIAGLHAADSGDVIYKQDVVPGPASKRSREQLRAIQTIFQNPDRSLNPSHTVRSLLERPLVRFEKSLTRKTRLDRAVEILNRVGLSSTALGQLPSQLSGGERQRVAIAQALAANPEVLVCDEITSALDVSVQAAVLEVLEGLRAEGLSMLFITHNLGVVRSLADRAIVMNGGRIVESGDVLDVMDRPTNEYTKALLAAAPQLSAA